MHLFFKEALRGKKISGNGRTLRIRFQHAFCMHRQAARAAGADQKTDGTWTAEKEKSLGGAYWEICSRGIFWVSFDDVRSTDVIWPS